MTPGGKPRARRRPGRPRPRAFESLALLGRVAEALSPDDLGASLDSTLEILRKAFGADDCEIFLGGPEGEVVLAASSGRDRALLSRRSRFPRGSGYPGIVAKTARPLSTTALDKDRRYLRKDVTAQGIRACIAVPLLGPGAVIGTLNVYWRRPQQALDSVLRVAEQVARPISTALRAGLARFRDRIEVAAAAGPEASAAAIEAMLEEVRSVAGAGKVALVVFESARGAARAYGTDRLLCSDLRKPDAGHCPILRTDTLSLDRLAGLSCAAASDPAGRPGCIPLSSGGAVRGVLRLDYGGSAPNPPSRHIVPLLAIAGAIAAHLGRGASTPAPAATARAAPPDPELRIRCLGPLRIERDGERIDPRSFGRSKARSLLELLLVRAGHPVSRDALIERLWPGVDEAAGANRLHGVVHALRAALEPDAAERKWRYVCNQGDRYFFNLDSPHQVDLFTFRAALDRGLRAGRAGRGDEARRALEEALAVCGGELFEDDPEAFEAERSEVRERRLEALARLAALLKEEGKLEAALEWLQQGVKLDPLREDLHQEVIRLLVQLGRRGDARRQYRLCERLLRQELGAEPLPETRSLEALIDR